MKHFALFAALVLTAKIALAAPVPIENAAFDAQNGKVAGWQLSGGKGRNALENKNGYITVDGSGDDSNYWRTAPLDVKPNTVYRLQFRARSEDSSGGTPITGPTFANRDLGSLGNEWRTFSTYFQTPRTINADNAWLRFGQWHVKGSVAFDDVKLFSAQPVYARTGNITLGDGETISGNGYAMRAPLGGDWGNTSRALLSHNSTFNSNRWVFGAGSEVIYKHEIAGRKQTSAQLDIGVNYYSGGQLAVDASRDGQNWKPLGTQDKLGTLSVTVPADLLPADALYIRLRAEAKTKVGANSDPGAFQVNNYAFRSTFDGAPLALRGSTQFFAVEQESPDLPVRIVNTGQTPFDYVKIEILRAQSGPSGVWSQLTFRPRPLRPSKPSSYSGSTGISSAPLKMGLNEISVLPILPLLYRGTSLEDLPTTGDFDGELQLWTGLGLNKKILFQASTSWHVPDLYASNYGEELPASNKKVGLWWCSSGWKISRTRPVPAKTCAALKIAAARNESEAAQFVLRPQTALRNFTVKPASLRSANGFTLGAENVEVLRVRYVDVAQPTDATGTAAPWPDPLPPIKAPLNLEANQNQPFWLRVRVPKNAKAGVYTGAVQLKADGYSASVPVQVTVWNFALPDRMTCETAFGFSPGNVFRYQNLTDPNQRREVIEKYFANFSAHHISPYDPAPLDPIKVTWLGGSGWQGGQRATQNPHSGAQSLLVIDDSATRQFSAMYDKPIAIPQRGVKLSFWSRTREAGGKSIVTVSHLDETGQWMSGRNNDMAIEGNGTWQRFERTITQFPAGARSCRVTLHAAPWKDDGSTTGAVFYDDVSLTDLETGKELLEGGDFEGAGAAPRPVLDWSRWDAAMEKAINRYGFTTFRLPLQGLGGGTFHARTEPELAGFRENTPEYKVALRAYLQEIESHLQAKGWLDEAYVYWFDEPDPKDYDFVMNGFRKLKENAPGLRRMLTEQPEKELFGGPNLWCPVSSDWKDDAALQRKANGDRFWWYVCTAPKAPYATLFIDHPATEMRVWLWQTWQRGIDGVLVWETNYWTSDAAYPDSRQNPYKDPMSWVSGYSQPRGSKQPWGNGDGRFIYPPENYDATTAPILSGPVDSIRWEMLRDGIEDYEYMAMLRRLLDLKPNNVKPISSVRRAQLKKLLQVPEAITQDTTNFTRDPAPMEKRRAELAAAIAELSN